MKKALVAVMLLVASIGATAGGGCWKNDTSNSLCHAGLSGASAFVTNQMYPNEPWKAFGLAMVPGVLKEVYDSQHGGKFDGKDLVMDAIGAGLVTFVLKVGDGTITVKPRSIIYQTSFGGH